MWYSQLCRTVMSRIEHLDFYEYSVLVAVIVAFGMFCMRGFGSRSRY